ncbi:hypothetical protein [Hyphomicrobium sp. NDB2Meth4]|uniref:hypothetical protein n=1 Tax=Hyphomicrobium sp. NDB2Meth4 TaxID=1892846 RepID=UPI000930C53D|nr:hypothetical protein [Hyphomicrobium sp. NDB2Meth4]
MPTTSGPHPGDERALASLTAAIGYGGIQATVLSALALVISGFSLYESSFKTAEIEVYVPPVVQYARDGGGDTEVFVVPVTITNSGARTGTVLSMELNVEDLKSHKTKRYYSAFLGEHQVDADAPNRSFAPLSIPGHGTFTDTVRFYPVGNPFPKIAEEAGDYKFSLSLVTAAPPRPDLVERLFASKVEPVVFERTLPWLSEQQLDQRRITISMPEKGWTAMPAAPAPLATGSPQ